MYVRMFSIIRTLSVHEVNLTIIVSGQTLCEILHYFQFLFNDSFLQIRK